MKKEHFFGFRNSYYFLLGFGGFFWVLAFFIAYQTQWFTIHNNAGILSFSVFFTVGAALISSPNYLLIAKDGFYVVSVKASFFRKKLFIDLSKYQKVVTKRKMYLMARTDLYGDDDYLGFAVYLESRTSIHQFEISEYRFIRGGSDELDRYLSFAKEVSMLTGLPDKTNRYSLQ